MERQEAAPVYTTHHPEDLKLPSVPQHEPPKAHGPSDITLPHLKTVLADIPTKAPHTNGTARDVDHPMAVSRTSIESVVSPSDTASVMSIEDGTQRSTSVSMEDPDVRLAAEALSGLGNPDFVPSPKTQSLASKRSPRSVSASSRKDNEPLLDLLVDAHPWVGSTVNGSLSAYNATKNFSPRFVRFGVDLVERNVGSPVANTVSSIGRRTGMEDGLRRYLGGRRPESPALSPGHGSKRRKVAPDNMEVDQAMTDPNMHASQEFLPAYQANKPPSYREEVSPHGSERSRALDRPNINRSWSARVFISTSALGVALSESSLRSLQYCVKLLYSATEHVESVMKALIMVLREYDQEQESSEQDRARRDKEAEAGFVIQIKSEREETAEVLARRIKQHCDDIWHTIQTVVNSVSTYAGGALPENARILVKGQLLSIPQRWRWASQSADAASSSSQPTDRADGGEDGKVAADGQSGPDENTRKAAHRMIAFATEGLDMMAQVNGIVNHTLQSAEQWLQSLGRSNREEEMMDADDPTPGE